MLDRIKQIAFMGRDFEVAGFLANHGVKGYMYFFGNRFVKDSQGPRSKGNGVLRGLCAIPWLGLILSFLFYGL
jgi:hypothetical protein